MLNENQRPESSEPMTREQLREAIHDDLAVEIDQSLGCSLGDEVASDCASEVIRYLQDHAVDVVRGLDLLSEPQAREALLEMMGASCIRKGFNGHDSLWALIPTHSSQSRGTELDTQISAQTIYAIALGAGATEFACGAHLDEALQELGVNDACLSWGEASSTFDCGWC